MSPSRYASAVLGILLAAMVSHVAIAGWSIAPKSVKDQLQGLSRGKQGRVRTVKNEGEIKGLYDNLTQGGKTIDPGSYPGTVKRLPDGTVVRMRPLSKSGGSTIDITYPDGTTGKVHVE